MQNVSDDIVYIQVYTIILYYGRLLEEATSNVFGRFMAADFFGRFLAAPGFRRAVSGRAGVGWAPPVLKLFGRFLAARGLVKIPLKK